MNERQEFVLRLVLSFALSNVDAINESDDEDDPVITEEDIVQLANHFNLQIR